MARERVLKVTILGDANSARRALGSLNAGLTTTQSRFSRFTSGLRRAAFIVTPALIGVGAGIGYALKQAAEAEKVGAQTEAVLKSTGRAAGVTKKEIEALSLQIMNYSGMSDEAVQSGQNLLLTFVNVRNEAGKNNKVFTDATKIAADMSVAMEQDLRTSVLQVGKALNDPIAGLTSLSRIGVRFTQETKDQIKALVESGETMKAQKIILRELRMEFGGSAKAAGDTFAGKLDILQEKLGNVAERIGRKLMPVAEDMIDWLDKNLPDVIANAEVLLGGFAEGLGNVAKAAKHVYEELRLVTDRIAELISNVIDFGQAIKSTLGDNLTSNIQDAVNAGQLRGGLPGSSLNPSGSGQPVAVPGLPPAATGSPIPSLGDVGGPGRIVMNLNVDGRRINRWQYRDKILLGNS